MIICISKKNDYSWVYINLSKEIEELMLDFKEKIEKEDIFEKEEDVCDHVTIKYGLKTDDPKDPKSRLEDEKGGEFYLGESSIFETEKYDVVKIEVESEDLKRIHDRLNELPHEDKYPDYKAHATIAYVKKGKGKKYVGKFKIDKAFKFKEVYFGDKQKKNHKIKLANLFNDWNCLRRF